MKKLLLYLTIVLMFYSCDDSAVEPLPDDSDEIPQPCRIKTVLRPFGDNQTFYYDDTYNYDDDDGRISGIALKIGGIETALRSEIYEYPDENTVAISGTVSNSQKLKCTYSDNNLVRYSFVTSSFGDSVIHEFKYNQDQIEVKAYIWKKEDNLRLLNDSSIFDVDNNGNISRMELYGRNTAVGVVENELTWLAVYTFEHDNLENPLKDLLMFFRFFGGASFHYTQAPFWNNNNITKINLFDIEGNLVNTVDGVIEVDDTIGKVVKVSTETTDSMDLLDILYWPDVAMFYNYTIGWENCE